MLSIAEKIKLKLQDLEQYNVDELEEKTYNSIDSDEESKSDIEVVNDEKLRRKSMDTPEPNQKFLQNYLIEKKLEIHENSQSCKNFELENKNDLTNKIILEKDINNKINEYVNNKLNRNKIIASIKNPEKNIKQNKKVSFPTTTNNNPINFHTNYSTDHSQNVDGNAKQNNFNYVELGNSNEDNFYYDENFLNFENTSHINYTKLEYKNDDLNPSIENLNTNNNLVKNYNKAFTLAPNFHSEDSDEDKNANVKEYFNVINLDDKEKLYYKKLNDDHNNNSEYNKVMIESTTNKDKKISWKFTKFIYFMEELLYCIMMVLLLIFNPLIILILKFVDFVKEKCKNYNENNNKKDSDSNNKQYDDQIGKSHLLYCGEIEEIEYDNIENLNNFNRILGYYDRYDNFFFNNCEFRRYRKIIKICFIIFSMFINTIILTFIEDKNLKLIMFFINNLYLLYHTLDFYNEKLFGNNENFNLYAD